MQQAHKLDCEAASSGCRFIVQSDDEEEAIELARIHLREAHGEELTTQELRSDYLKIT